MPSLKAGVLSYHYKHVIAWTLRTNDLVVAEASFALFCLSAPDFGLVKRSRMHYSLPVSFWDLVDA